MNRSRICSVLLASFVLCAVTTYPDWPRFRGPSGNSIVSDPAFDPAAVAAARTLWTARVGKGYSAISIVGNRGVTMGNDGTRDHVVCLDVTNGRELWRFDYPAKPGSYPGPRASPWIENGRVYTVSYWGHVHCLDLATGRSYWNVDLVKAIGADVGSWGIAGSPVVTNQRIYINAGHSGCALDAATGRVIWKGMPGKTGFSTPVLVPFRGRLHVALFGAKAFLLVDAEQGRIAAEHPWETSWDVNAADPLMVQPDRFFISSGYRRGCALVDVSSTPPREVWNNKTLASHFSSPVLHQGHIYGCDGNAGRGDLVCLRASDGQEQWRQKLGFGSLILANEYIVYFNEKGDIIVGPVDSKGFQPMAQARGIVTDGKVWTAPVLDRGILYMRSDQGTIVAVDARRAGGRAR